MPTYEYLCQNCGERLEVFQAFSDKPLKKHADCGGALQKVFHASGVVFKGSGYYVNDSRSNGSKSSETSEKSNGSKESKPKADSASKKTESGKSEASKSESKTSSD